LIFCKLNALSKGRAEWLEGEITWDGIEVTTIAGKGAHLGPGIPVEESDAGASIRHGKASYRVAKSAGRVAHL
jgi:hypothetical protein